ncbi:MAG: hypothetical protein HYX60_10720 [Legionella longbeachae]|nr:hypothetical protein [Legionella longbeachae]
MQGRIDLNQKTKLFCFFTGSTKGLVELTNVEKNEENETYQFTISLPSDFNDIITKNTYIQLNGILCQVIDCNNKNITISTTFELVANTNLKNSSKGKKVSLGLPAIYENIDDQMFFIHPSSSFTANIEQISILTGHQYTLKIDLSCDSSSIDLEEEKHIGFSGSSLLVRELKTIEKEGLHRFSIYAGKQTQEKTAFNRQLLNVGDVVNINHPKTDEPVINPYPYELKSLQPKI